MKRLSRLLCLAGALLLSIPLCCNPVAARGDEPDYIVVIPGETMPPTTTPPTVTTTPPPTTIPTMPEKGTGFTEDGVLSTCDLLFDKATNKQYIVVETRNGQTFYRVIDYDKPLDEDEERYQTYFLNPVDEADLLALIEQEETQPIVCSCVDKCVLGAVDEDCELCRQNIRRCVGKAVETEPPTTAPAVQPESNNNPAAALAILLLLGGGAGAGYYFYVKKKSQEKKQGSTDLSEYDYGMDDDDLFDESEESDEK